MADVEFKTESEDKVCKDCYYNDGEVHAECVVCDKMTREEAISILSRPRTMKNVPSDILKAHEVAIKALEQLPCEDAISRQAVLDGLASIAKAKAKSDAQKSLMGRVMFFTEHLPSAQPDLSEYSDKLWKAAYERGKAEAHDEIVCCEDCKNRGDDDCPMRFIEWVEYDDDGYIEHDDIIHDYTKDDGFCDRAERRTDE